MIQRRLTGLTLMTGLLLCLLAVPAVLAQASPADVNQLSPAKSGAQPAFVSPRLSLPGRSNPSTSPASNTHTAPATSTVSIAYAEPISPATVSTQAFAVYAMQTGLLTQAYHVSGGIIGLTPRRPFQPGELVQASATTGTLNLSGQGPVSPTVRAFRVAATGGYAHGVYVTPESHPNQVWLNTQSRLFLPVVAGGPHFTVASVRQLTPCENEGRHHIFTHVVDAQGAGISGIPLMICWGPSPVNCAFPTTDETGWMEFAMFKGTYSVQVATGTSQVASGLTGDFAIDEMCEETGNPVANARYHISFEVIFLKE